MSKVVVQQRAGKAARPSGFSVREVKGGGIRELFCPGCGVQIAATVEVETDRVRRESRNRTVVFVKEVLRRLSNFKEAEITFDDGSKHITILCATCLKNDSTDNLEKIYAGELAEILSEGRPNDWRLLAKRVPVTMKEV